MRKRKQRTSLDTLSSKAYNLNSQAGNRQGSDLDLAGNRRAIWYELTDLAQDIVNWAPRQAPRDARVVADLMNDVWAVWDKEWQSGHASPKLISELLQRIHDRSSSTDVRDRVLRIEALLKVHASVPDSPSRLQ
jgi:hypothetical protein